MLDLNEVLCCINYLPFFCRFTLASFLFYIQMDQVEISLQFEGVVSLLLCLYQPPQSPRAPIPVEAEVITVR